MTAKIVVGRLAKTGFRDRALKQFPSHRMSVGGPRVSRRVAVKDSAEFPRDEIRAQEKSRFTP
ncbi:MAG: hypothetical protein A3E78_00635 [Alphaproteobacteria bacterium RIFCSPHIGHO2_12_FULL_63_12]|nr:MAG: hypothetical protein A3E78_00635 [Alphaproteobacteria bacterium RIFCSPHIGHO2_12_FULL_63_12]